MFNVSKSPWLLHYDGSSCNGCDIEVLGLPHPRLRRGAVRRRSTRAIPSTPTSSSSPAASTPRTSPWSSRSTPRCPRPKVVVAVGICACNGGIFKDCYNIHRRRGHRHSRSTSTSPGCAARPEAIIDGVVKAVALLDEKRKAMQDEEEREA